MKKTFLTVVAVITLASGAHADVIFGNSITDSDPSAFNPFTSGQIVDANLSASGIGRGSGITGNAGGNRYNAAGWGTLDEAGSLSNSKYFTLSLNVNSGFEIDFTSFSFIAQGSATGAHSFAVFSSIGGFTLGNELFTFTQPGTSSYTTAMQTVNLSASAFQNVTGPVEFRIYAWGAGNATTGTFSINEFSFDGSVVAVPEPSTYVLLIAGASLMVLAARRKRTA